MRVLVGCEHSGTMRRAFRALGHDAFSCDILPPADGFTHHHLQRDVRTVLHWGWDLGIFHPDCTYLTYSAEWAYRDPDFVRYPGVGYHQRVQAGTKTGEARRHARQRAADFAEQLWSAPIELVALENPISYLQVRIGKPTQIVQPHWFGDDASKATCWWLKNLPALVPTKPIAPRMVDGRPRWSNQTDSGQNRLSPSPERWAIRATTYPGHAAACAEQWAGRAVMQMPEHVRVFEFARAA